MNENVRKWFEVEGKNYFLDGRVITCSFISEDLTVCNDPDWVCFSDTVASLRMIVNEIYEITVEVSVGDPLL